MENLKYLLLQEDDIILKPSELKSIIKDCLMEGFNLSNCGENGECSSGRN